MILFLFISIWTLLFPVFYASPLIKCGEKFPGKAYVHQGTEVGSRYKYPWLVNIRYKDGSLTAGGNNVLCGGVAISKDLILTARHCLTEAREPKQKTAKARDLYVYYWSYNVSDPYDRKDLRVPVRKIFKHPYHDMQTNSFDLAILQTSFKIPKIMPICLPCNTGIHKPFEPAKGEKCVAVGWAKTEDLVQSEVPLEGQIPIVNYRYCKYKWDNVPDRSMLCAGTSRKRDPVTCHGYSGGPLMCERNGHWFVSGITSWGAINCWQKPAVFNNVVRMRDYISIVLHYLGQTDYCPNDNLFPPPIKKPRRRSKSVQPPCDATLFQWEKGVVYMVANFTRKNYILKNIKHGWECSRRCCENKQCKSVLYYPKYQECYQFVNRLCELPPSKINRNYKEEEVIYYGKPGCSDSKYKRGKD